MMTNSTGPSVQPSGASCCEGMAVCITQLFGTWTKRTANAYRRMPHVGFTCTTSRTKGMLIGSQRGSDWYRSCVWTLRRTASNLESLSYRIRCSYTSCGHQTMVTNGSWLRVRIGSTAVEANVSNLNLKTVLQYHLLLCLTLPVCVPLKTENVCFHRYIVYSLRVLCKKRNL